MSLAEDLKKQTKQHDWRTKKIDFQVDTLANSSSSSGGYFSPSNGTITMNYHEDNEGLLNWELGSRDVILYHEQKHRSNANKGFTSRDINVSPEQYYKLCMADEISANMAELVYLREEYIKTKDINVFDMDGGRFAFYKKAVQKGEVNPLSSDPKDFEKDMSLIMNGTQKMWMEWFSETYNDAHESMTKWCVWEHSGSLAENNEEYQKQLDIAYTIGGINFKKYMQKDVELPYPGKNRYEFEYFQRMKHQLSQIDGENMSLGQYNDLVQHVYIADKIRAEIRCDAKDLSKFTPERLKQYKALVQEKIKTAKKELQTDKQTKEIHYFTNQVVGRGGDRAFIPSDNDANYQAALKQVYNINGIDYYSLMNVNPQEKMPVEKSAWVQEFENENAFMRCLYKVSRWEHDAVDWVKDGCVKGWNKLFGKDKNTVKVDTNEHLKNYPEWSKNKRVSEIQYAEILDLDKNVITRPKVYTKQAAKKNNAVTQSQAVSKEKVSWWDKLFGKKKSKKTVVEKPKENPQPQPKPKPKPKLKSVSKLKIPFNQITGSYTQEQLKQLCGNPQRWNQGRSCNAAQYSKAAEITGLPAELLAYAFEVNRKNFPSQNGAANKVINGSKLSDEEIAKSVAAVLSRYDIEKGSFFALRSTPKTINLGVSLSEHVDSLSGRGQAASVPSRRLSFAHMRNNGYGVEQILAERRARVA